MPERMLLIKAVGFKYAPRNLVLNQHTIVQVLHLYFKCSKYNLTSAYAWIFSKLEIIVDANRHLFWVILPTNVMLVHHQ